MRGFVFPIAVAGMLIAGPAAALTYNVDFNNGTQDLIDPAYGDNAQADLSYRAIDASAYGDVATIGGVFHWGPGYGDLTGVIWGELNPSHAEIRIEAVDPLAAVTLNGFQLGGWLADENAEWFVYDLA